MGKFSFPIYDENEGNRWSDFVERKRAVFGARSFGDKVHSFITKILRKDKLSQFSKNEIKAISKMPELMPSEKEFAITQQTKIFTTGSCFFKIYQVVFGKCGLRYIS